MFILVNPRVASLNYELQFHIHELRFQILARAFNLLTRALFPIEEKNLLIVFCGTQGGLITTALKKSM